jgi:hypothetical protein
MRLSILLSFCSSLLFCAPSLLLNIDLFSCGGGGGQELPQKRGCVLERLGTLVAISTARVGGWGVALPTEDVLGYGEDHAYVHISNESLLQVHLIDIQMLV